MKIYVITCNGISDIGKGWLTAALGQLSPKSTLPIKLDPFLNLEFPAHLGIKLSNALDKIISDDFIMYKKAGMPVFPECNIVCGKLVLEFLQQKDTMIRPGEIKKRTFSDLSYYLAKNITEVAQKLPVETLLIEVGGTIEDLEHVYIPGALRFLSHPELLGEKPKLVHLSYFDFAENFDGHGYRVKTQYIRRGLRQLFQYYYGMELTACFVRRRNVPSAISDDVLIEDLKNVAYETQLSEHSIVYLPNIKSSELSAITELIRTTKLF